MNLNDFSELEGNVKVSQRSQNCSKMSRLEIMLCDLGYDVDTGKDIVDAIEQHHLDLSQFDFPYGSFEAFKEHALAGEFDFDVDKRAASPEQIAELRQLVKDKKLYVRY